MAFDYAKLSRPKQRAIVLLRTRNLKMARNAHAYVRGSTVKFYEWLEVVLPNWLGRALGLTRPSHAGPLPASEPVLIDVQMRWAGL